MVAFSLRRRFGIRQFVFLCAAATAFASGASVAIGQDLDDGQAVSVRRPSLEPRPNSTLGIDLERERLFNELAEEFSTFDRLGHLVRRVSQLVKPSVIHIEAHKTEERGGSRESYDEAGSGVVIQMAGNESWVLTNRHVISGASPRQILLRSHDGREFYPTKVVSDPSTDVALMKIDTIDLPAARLGDSAATEIGDFVIAIGSPFGLSPLAAEGVLGETLLKDDGVSGL